MSPVVNLQRTIPRLANSVHQINLSSVRQLAPLLLKQCITTSTRTFSSTNYRMSDMTPILTKNAMAPVGPYSQAIKTPHAIYCSGQLPADAQGNIVQGSMTEKTAAVIKALSAVLTEGGSSLERVVKVQIFLTDMKDFAEMNQEYERWIKHKPARSCVAVKELPKGVDVEIECVALP